MEHDNSLGLEFKRGDTFLLHYSFKDLIGAICLNMVIKQRNKVIKEPKKNLANFFKRSQEFASTLHKLRKLLRIS